MSISHQKVKSVSKVMLSRGPALQKKIEETLKMCADIVGATLGPGGMSVIIERQEAGLAPIATKDGVTVFKSLGFTDPVQQVLMESAREASVRTAAEAGDGTTTATILSYALVKNIAETTRRNPHLSPQILTRTIQKIFKNRIEPLLAEWAIKCDLAENKDLTFNVARISANGDTELAKAVMECYDISGDKGNVTIVEASGASEYEVSRIEGYPVSMGYEESCGPFFPEFINDKASQQAVLKKPMWLLYNGMIRDFNEIAIIAQNIALAASEGKASPALVVVANGFSELFVATCAASFASKDTVRIFPLLAPKDVQKTAQLDFLNDMAALTGAKVFDPLNNPLDGWASMAEFGHGQPGPELFEAGRFRSTVVGRASEDLIIERVDELSTQLQRQSTGKYDANILAERIAKLTGGIARLTVRGASNGEVKEKRDRAEDAVCAVRAAIQSGALPGGGVTWMRLWSRFKVLTSGYEALTPVEKICIESVIMPSVREVVLRLFTNAGFTDKEASDIVEQIQTRGKAFDLHTQEWIDPIEKGLLDSHSAVRDSLKNAISGSALLGTCGGVVVFPRDSELERREAVEALEYTKAANYNEANERP